MLSHRACDSLGISVERRRSPDTGRAARAALARLGARYVRLVREARGSEQHVAREELEIGGVVLGILALLGFLPTTLVLIGFLGVGAALLLGGSAFGARMFGVMRHAG